MIPTTMTSKPSFCPECDKNGFPGTPSMKDHPLCGDCHDIAEVNAQELAEWHALQDEQPGAAQAGVAGDRGG